MHRIRPRRLALALPCLMGIAMISLPGCRGKPTTSGPHKGIKEKTQEQIRSSYKGNGKHRNQTNTPDGK